MLIAMRNAMMAGGKRLPYDAEVEYLESTGTQWIDAIFSGYTDGAEMDSVFSIDGSGDYVNGFGNNQGSGSTTASAWFYVRASNSSRLPYCVNYDAVGRSVYVAMATQHHLIARFGGGTLDGVAYTQSGTRTRTHQDPFIIFPQSSSPVIVRLWSLKLKNNNVLVRDFIPVRFTNENGVSEGAMFDRANPTVGMNPDGSVRDDGLYRNRGTGAFLIGPDASAANGGGV